VASVSPGRSGSVFSARAATIASGEQKAQHVELMDERFGDQQTLLPSM